MEVPASLNYIKNTYNWYKKRGYLSCDLEENEWVAYFNGKTINDIDQKAKKAIENNPYGISLHDLFYANEARFRNSHNNLLEFFCGESESILKKFEKQMFRFRHDLSGNSKSVKILRGQSRSISELINHTLIKNDLNWQKFDKQHFENNWQGYSIKPLDFGNNRGINIVDNFGLLYQEYLHPSKPSYVREPFINFFKSSPAQSSGRIGIIASTDQNFNFKSLNTSYCVFDFFKNCIYFHYDDYKYYKDCHSFSLGVDQKLIGSRKFSIQNDPMTQNNQENIGGQYIFDMNKNSSKKRKKNELKIEEEDSRYFYESPQSSLQSPKKCYNTTSIEKKIKNLKIKEKDSKISNGSREISMESPEQKCGKFGTMEANNGFC